jgi:signal transduction histidine kinase/DNA-binding NarL/FixJ family response regulator
MDTTGSAGSGAIGPSVSPPKGTGLVADFAISLSLTALVIVLDFATGVKMSFSLFYIAPVVYIAWRRGLLPGLALALVCVVVRHYTDLFGGRRYDSSFVAFWNNGVRTGLLVVAAIGMSRIRLEVSAARKAREDAIAASHAKTDFLRNMSHEIRTPLNALLAMAELLSESPLDNEQAGYVKVFKAEGRNLLNLITDLLDTAKIEAGRFSTERIPFSLSELLAEVASEAGSQARHKGLEFRLDVDSEVPVRIMGDPWLLKRTLMNLTGNAVKFTQTGAIGVKVSLDRGEAAGRLLFSVRDSGIGIPADKLPSLFAPFAQADLSTRRRFGGTGLGLSLCKRFVELMGGTIDATSLPGQGSVFSFDLPLETAPEPPGGGVGVAASAEEAPVIDAALRILVADDYDVNRDIVRAFLKNTPCRLEEAGDGASAITKIMGAEWDLVLMDLQMPEIDGYEATRTIRAWEKRSGRPRLPMIALTAHASAEDVAATKVAGFDGHLAKPFAKKDLIKAILEATCGVTGKGGRPAAAPETPALDEDIAKLVPKFIGTMKSLHGQAREASSGGDFVKIAAIGHKYKGSGGSFGFDRLSELGDELERAAKDGDRKAVDLALEELEAFLKAVKTDG